LKKPTVIMILPHSASALSDQPQPPEGPVQRTRKPKSSWRRRRAATAMEYLFMASLILVVVMIGVDYFGQQTKKVSDKTNTAIQNATQGHQSNPP
jgi:hypothetical protein